jgi:LppX_LprAFG lipoprotein
VTVTPIGAAGAGEQDDLALIASSGDELAKSRSAKFRGTTSSPGGGAGPKVTFNGAFNFESRTGEYTVDAESLGLQGSGKVRALLVGGLLYLSLNALDAGASASNPELEGKKWLELDPALFGGEGQIGQSDPNGSLDALRGAAGDVKKVGTEKIRGTRTTHYRVTIDVEQAVANAPEEEQEQVRSSIAALGSGTIPADVWIDSKGRLRKMRLRVGGSATRGGSVGFEYFDLGARVNVEQPPAGEVVDFFDLLGGETTPPTT